MAKISKKPSQFTRKRLRKMKPKKRKNHEKSHHLVDSCESEPPSSSSRNDVPEAKFHVSQSDTLKLQKLQRDMKSQRIKQLLEDNAKEDRLIKSLEKKMKLKARNKGHLPKSFITEGLDYLLQVCEYEKCPNVKEDGTFQIESEFVNDLEIVTQNDTNQIFEKVAKKRQNSLDDREVELTVDVANDLENIHGLKCKRKTHGRAITSRKGTVKQDLDDSSRRIKNLKKLTVEETAKETSHHLNGSEKNASSTKVWQVHLEDEKMTNDELQENIYGRLKSDDRTISQNDHVKYVPPQLRGEHAEYDRTNSDKLRRLEKQLKGQLNRLTGRNVHSIATQIEAIYAANSRHDTNHTLTKLVKESLISDTSTPMRLIAEHVLLISILHANIGVEIGAYLLQTLAQDFHKLINESDLLIENKQIDNVIAIFVQLYNFKVFRSCLMYEILDRLLRRFQEKDIDLILLVLKNVGFNLRKDNPSKLKEVILAVQSKASSSSALQVSVRAKFMLDTLLAIKNNNRLKILQSDSDYIDSLKKLSKTLFNAGKFVNELKITLADLLNAETKGRWWIVGSAWTGQMPEDNDRNQVLLTKNAALTFDQKLLNLAKKHRMNTDIRKNIFCILMSAEDFLDAFEKLSKLGLKGNQCQEIIYVTMHCLLQEKEYNPYYSFIAEQFSSSNRKYQMAIQLCSWDKFKDIDSLSDQQVSNLAKFLVYLIQNEKLSLSVLKVLQFTEMNKTMVKFIRQLLLSLLLTSDDVVIGDIFSAISKSEKSSLLKQGLQLFLHHFILKEAGKEASGEVDEHVRILTKKIEIAENAMYAHSSEFRI